MSNDLQIIRQLEKVIGIELSEFEGEDGSLNETYQLDEHQNVTILHLDRAGLKAIPQLIFQLKGLMVLPLGWNKITRVPSGIRQLQCLTELSLYGNQLTELPKELWELENLTSLYLGNNQLKVLPPEIGKLKNLTELTLDSNQLRHLPPEIGKLKNLTRLYLDDNQLTDLPPEIGQLENLMELTLGSNQLTKLPPEIGRLKNLEILPLGWNQLAELPPEIGLLRKLDRFYCNNNPLKQPPPEIIKQGTNAIMEYLRQIHEQKTAQLVNEAKLILVGQGDVGKSCLANRLKYDAFQKGETTEGIDILSWKIPAPEPEEEEEIRLNVWDFGGQEIYHATHQFFLTKRSVYLLVWNARKARDYEHIYSWLHTIEAFAEDSPVILVMSKWNERDDDLNMKELKEKFPQIIDLYKVDSQDGRGIFALKETIQETAWSLPHMKTPWVSAWFRVREMLEKLGEAGRDYVAYKGFYQICQKEGLDKNQTDILDEYLHDLGVIIHFRDRATLSGVVILKPEWATDAVYKVLDTHSVRNRGGILLHSELEQVWESDRYPSSVFSLLLKLMNRFELAYELPDKKSHLVAELLPSTEPEFDWDDSDNLRFFYRYDFLPAGVMTRFIVLVHQTLESRPDGRHLCWREGAILRQDGTRAFVKVRPLEKLVDIRIRGPHRRKLLAVIWHKFRHINKSIKKVKITKEIPCNCSETCSHRFNYLQLLKGEGMGRESVDCPVSWQAVSLSSLLDRYQIKGNRVEDSGVVASPEVSSADEDIAASKGFFKKLFSK